MEITYTTDLAGIGPEDMDGFYVGWTSPPANGERVEILRRSTHAVIAMDRTKVVGFVNAISNGHMAYIPLLEVLPEYQGRGIGTEMVKRVIAEIGEQYGVDTRVTMTCCRSMNASALSAATPWFCATMGRRLGLTLARQRVEPFGRDSE